MISIVHGGVDPLADPLLVLPGVLMGAGVHMAALTTDAVFIVIVAFCPGELLFPLFHMLAAFFAIGIANDGAAYFMLYIAARIDEYPLIPIWQMYPCPTY